MPSVEQLQPLFMLMVAAFGAFASALWLSMVMWTFRDMRARSRDPFAQIFATLLVALLTLPWLVVYLILRPRETLAEAYQRELEDEALLQEIEGKQHCPGCEQPVREEWVICPSCYTRLRKNCEHCGKLMELQWNVCPYCGESVPGYSLLARRNGLAAEPAEELEAPEPEPAPLSLPEKSGG
jgi:RNA polymerase subunit RPABC4/transcription elongation factor Spt4